LLPLPASRYKTMLGNKFTVRSPTSRIPPETLTSPQQLFRTSVPSQAVMPPAFLPSSPVTGQPSIFFQISRCTRLINPCAGSRPSSSRVSYETLHLPLALTVTTRRIVCSRNVEGVCLVERSVGRSPYIDPDGIFQNLAPRNVPF